MTKTRHNKKPKIHITFDFETLGNTSQAPPVQIAAVAWADKKKFSLVDNFQRNITFESLAKYPFVLTYSTISWWLSSKCDQEARDRAFDQTNAIAIEDVIQEFGDWIAVLEEDYTIETIWQHSSFDDPILRNVSLLTGIEMPYKYWKASDIRTLKVTKGNPTVKFKGTKHVALDDCEYQAEFINELLHRSNKEVKKIKRRTKKRTS